jgi:hypothetical protein
MSVPQGQQQRSRPLCGVCVREIYDEPHEVADDILVCDECSVGLPTTLQEALCLNVDANYVVGLRNGDIVYFGRALSASGRMPRFVDLVGASRPPESVVLVTNKTEPVTSYRLMEIEISVSEIAWIYKADS